MYFCPHCAAPYEKRQSMSSHSKWCKFNPTPYVHTFKFEGEQKEKWLEAVRKSNSDPEIIKRKKETLKKSIAEGKYIPHQGNLLDPNLEQQRRNKISETMRKNPNSGGLRIGSGRGKKQWYESPIAGKVYLRSSYEIEYAKWLDSKNIKWKQNLIKFPFTWENSIRYYYPDFYLIDEDLFIEIKGYETDKDKAKWEAFPYKLKVLFKKDLLDMGLNIPKY